MTRTILDDLNEQHDLSDLLPCPFCGGQSSIGTAKITRATDDDQDAVFTGYFINCASCGTSNQGIAEGFSTVEKAKAHWQTRAQQRELLALEQLLQDVLDSFGICECQSRHCSICGPDSLPSRIKAVLAQAEAEGTGGE